MGDDGLPQWVGYVSCLVAGLFWGSNFVPVKKYNSGDGVYFQWILCSGIWVTGFIVNVIRASQNQWTFPVFQPLAMLGGFLWCTGNMMTVPIIQCIGLSVGLFLWSTISMFLGWLTGTLGLFHLKAHAVYIPWLNYTGAALALLSGVFFAMIKPNKDEEEEDRNYGHEEAIAFLGTNATINAEEFDERSFVQKLTLTQQRILGVTLSILAGCMYGTNFDPPQYIMDNCNEKCSQNGLDYIFSHFCGIYLTSTVYFLIYCMLKKNKPFINPELTAPAFVSGVMWATAQSLAFLGSSAVGFVISFPIFSTIPGLIGSLWGILLFKEISGMKNYLAFAGAAILVSSSVVSVCLSQALKPANATNTTLFEWPQQGFNFVNGTL